jgi:hypothetical protein
LEKEAASLWLLLYAQTFWFGLLYCGDGRAAFFLQGLAVEEFTCGMGDGLVE